ncbi:hypothetical protein [Pseudomonas asiatica]|uniref:hypothetical protein n=1 Tax=Pseudomonas asiatica TaxID=2219225 RepID=UPI003B92637C
MLPIRVHVITQQDLLEHKKEPVRDWRLGLKNTGLTDAQRIAYVLQYDEEGGADLFRVGNCICEKARQFSGMADSFRLELNACRGLRKESVDTLFMNFATGQDLSEAFVRQLENYLAVSHQPASEDEAHRPGLKTMTFAEARAALANYYAVDETQVHIQIVG